MTEVKGSILGNAVLRREDPTLLTGEDKYFDDMEIDGLGYVYFARSPVAHANIVSIETADAKAIDGVVDVWTADDLDLAPYLGFPMFPPHFARPPLAKGKVRLVGDIIAVVVADSFSAAADGAAAIWMDYEPLPAVTDPEKALEDDAPILFEENESNQCFETGIGLEDGDPNEDADHIAKVRIVSQRLAGVPLESNGIIAVPENDGSLTAWIPSQNPISVRSVSSSIGHGTNRPSSCSAYCWRWFRAERRCLRRTRDYVGIGEVTKTTLEMDRVTKRKHAFSRSWAWNDHVWRNGIFIRW